MKDLNWYQIKNIEAVDSPALAIYPDRVRSNINELLSSIDDVSRLRPHIKTHKSTEVCRMMLEAGIRKFKCATIAEAEVLANEGAPDVLLAYQPVGPKGQRLLQLIQKFPHTQFACLIDNLKTATALAALFESAKATLNVFVDLNVGMNRTGVSPTEAFGLIKAVSDLKGINIIGLHAYDGHIRDTNMAVRTAKCDEAFAPVLLLQREASTYSQRELILVAGGTPTFSVHRIRKDRECSPGTFTYWDKGYSDILQEQKYQFAALVITRVVSLPKPGVICVDLGHKAIASENPIDKRVSFLNAGSLTPVGHSEEHMVFQVNDNHKYRVGDVLYGVPFHICPTVALYQNPAVVNGGVVSEYWNTQSRSRAITI
ncbi:D-TA family PLP-dependent enzyme [Chryseolinea sp. T2]|uniref:D-TA family PLP-dependent enzyme n=1 Tax=Chryseolinea sp. T2 TaxID=3129255 RepID=UPI00307895F2